MKLFFVFAVATSAMLLVQGAPHITSEEMGKAVEQLKEMITSEIQSAYYPRARQGAQSAYFPREQNYHAQSAWQPRKQGYGRQDKVTAQVRGANIENCGQAGDAIQSALNLSPVNTLLADAFGVLVNCEVSPGCVQVRVDVPADDKLLDVDICDLGNGQACVHVYVEPSKKCRSLIPIIVPIPLSNGQEIKIDIRIDPEIKGFTGFFSGLNQPACATVDVKAPAC